jgi:hypothetical protein
VLLYVATERFGVVGAAAAWTIRAAFDPVLFVFTRPSRADMRALVISAALVLAAMAAGLALPWTSPTYWAVMAALAAAACFQHRAVLVEGVGNLRKGLAGAPK